MDIQGISLSKGGLFDIDKDFQIPHKGHRVGNDVDLGLKRTRQVSYGRFCRNILKNSITAATNTYQLANTYAEGENPNSPRASHWHLRVQFPSNLAFTINNFSTMTADISENGSVRQKELAFNSLNGSSVVESKIGYDQSIQKYSYAYTVTNNLSDNQSIDSFSIDFGAALLTKISPSGWVAFPKGENQGIHWGAVEVSPMLNNLVDDGGITQSTAAISPGNSLNGFAYESNLPPAIRQYNIKVFKPLPTFSTEEELEDGLESLPISEEESIKGYTIAPYNPAGMSNVEFLNQLSSAVNQSRTLGWIQNDESAQRLKDWLQSAKYGLNSRWGGFFSKQILYSFLSELEIQKDQMTDEAYSLLYYNAKYYIDAR